MIGVIDYGRGNLFSLSQALQALDLPHRITDRPDDMAEFEIVILPGVGAFGDAMAGLRDRGLDTALQAAVKSAKRILGICLGMQLLATRSEEFGDHEGLGLIDGAVRKLPPPDADGGGVRVPNMGWRQVRPAGSDTLLTAGNEPPYFYFVHSYGFHCDQIDDVAATITVNGAEVAAMVRRNNVIGCQFHPEKSGPDGLALLKSICQSDD